MAVGKDGAKRILLVDDNEKILRGNRRMYEWDGYEIAEAMTLAKARTRIAESKPDAIILDMMLPDGSGLDFV